MICKHCHKEFTPSSFTSVQKFCNSKCRDDFHYKPTPKTTKICRCGNTFSGPKNKKYCSRKCGSYTPEKKEKDKLRHFYTKGRGLLKHCICRSCGTHFDTHNKRSYCKPECRKSLIEKSAKPKLLICQFKPCGKEYYSSQSHSKYCCIKHQDAAKNKANRLPLTRDELRALKALKPKSSRIYIKTCPITNKLFVTKNKGTKYHTDAFKLSATGKSRYVHIPIPKQDLVCTDCGEMFQSVNKKRTRRILCRSCGQKEDGRINKAKRRAAERGNTVEHISPYQVFKRDKWHCRCCNKWTPWKHRGKGLHDSPELDHIIPISKGGPHTMANVQLLCRSCNNLKSDKIINLHQYRFQYEMFG